MGRVFHCPHPTQTLSSETQHPQLRGLHCEGTQIPHPLRTATQRRKHPCLKELPVRWESDTLWP